MITGVTDRLRSRSDWMDVSLVLLCAAVVRMLNLRGQPPFIDEAGHIYGATHYDFYPLMTRLRAGKVLGYFVFYPTAKFAGDPLFATRFLVALIGVLTVLGVFVFTRRIANLTAAYFAATAWALMPFVVFHDRMALHDPLVSLCMIWSMVFSVDAVRRKSPLSGALAGCLLAAAILTKINAAIGVVWVASIAVALWKGRDARGYIKTALAFLIGLIVPILPMLLAIERLGMSAGPAQATDSSVLWPNVQTAAMWFTTYNSVPFALLAAAALLESLMRPSRMKVCLLFSFLVSLLVHALVFKEWYPRYFIPSLLPLTILAGMAVSKWLEIAIAAWKRRYSWPLDWMPLGGTIAMFLLVAGSAFHWIRSDWISMNGPVSAELPPIDRIQYVDAWSAAYGLDRVAAFLKSQAEQSRRKVVVLVGSFGTHGWWSLPLITPRDADIRTVSGFDGSRYSLSKAVLEAPKQPTFLLFEPPVLNARANLLALITPAPVLVLEYKRPRGEGGFQLYALDASARMGLNEEQSKLVASGSPVIQDIANPNGMEALNGVPFFWLGTGDALLQIFSPRNGKATLEATFLPGPSVTGNPERHISVQGNNGVRATFTIAAGRQTITVPLQAGANELTVSSLDKPSGVKLSNGDSRPLILGIQGLRVADFQPER
jgi:4-amino-4-deoxy-L-arabinose transferase-like glycosyltransferase